MKTLICDADGTLSVKEIPLPGYSEKQALVKTIACGICNGTDAKLIHRAFKGFPVSRYPLMLGHEGVGEVIEVGSEVKSFKVGDKVLLPFVDADPEKYGTLESAWGAYSEYAVVTDPLAYPEGEAPEHAMAQTVLPPWVNPVDAAMIVTLREVLSAVRRFGIRAGNSVAVFGCGPVGLTFIRFLKLLGAGPIIAFDVVDDKLAVAKANGADYTFNSGREDVSEVLHGICPNGAQFVLDAVGLTSLINLSMELLCDQGKMCCYGIAPVTHMDIDWEKAPYNWTLQFQQFPSKREEGEATEQILTWLREGTISLKDYISDYFPFEHILEAFEKLERREIAKKGIVVYD
ncbi:MAG: zinc-binding dehydrogenase [Clostridia bacterium]|nr:zinc-binding dehydrogenase [Clostridia bacterium]